MKGWFDAFRSDGGPTLYSSSNRTPVTGDSAIITLCVVFCTLFLAFLIIFPGIRKERFSTFTSVSLSLFVGAVILVAKFGSSWHVANTEVRSCYHAFSKEKVHAYLGAFIGLDHVNVTLAVPLKFNSTGDIDFNERFKWQGAGQMGDSYQEALTRGLPFPILTVAEYLSLNQEGFTWGGQYRAAGYYGTILLWAAFAVWLLMNVLLMVVPRYGAYAMVVTGMLMLATNLVYWRMLPVSPLVIRFEQGTLQFALGWCFWIVLVTGGICLIVGSVIAVMDLVYPHLFSTILEVDYDTPYDRHIIIEESHVTRNNKKRNNSNKLEEPPTAGLGTRILRRLSKRERLEDRKGVDNEGFEMDPPKSPWRYPFHRNMLDRSVPMRVNVNCVPGGLGGFQRSVSQDSGSSSNASSLSLGISFLHRERTLQGDFLAGTKYTRT